MRLPAEEIAQLIGPGPYIMAEVGVYEGDHFEEFLRKDGIPLKAAYLVDSWLLNFPGGYAGHSQEDWNKLYIKTVAKFQHLTNVCIMRMTSEEAAPFVPNNLDIVYIDADHKYDPVLLDIHIWLPKVRVGGLLWGDDWSYDTVEAAVTDFIKLNPQFSLCVRGTQWWFVKTQEEFTEVVIDHPFVKSGD